ncbi:NAD(P)-dependent dehydrogenase, short-chain alcohol dehydrogenase family [Tardiphaga sp. OK246]|uniref:SDR family NAD(P)-dependent oxidoreductase n=1 Tax=Tardiphaga sp. OK246 TaxID=1855307 RepID=UPI000B730BE4|nr:SDR family oxidoreductase [Tardiphaga sp. OK246]SNT31920.1 NAD(P)-dependent dehydrogenase, short-chain alcohol dehydrogenase family [Tardiphaga sp. OK246]
MPDSLKGKVALITGAAQGLGALFATSLAEVGVAVILGDVAPTDDTCAKILAKGGSAVGTQLDVTDSASLRAAVALASDRFGSLDILVNNAAIAAQIAFTRITDLSTEDWDRVMTVNARGTFEAIKASVPIMKRNGYGKIVNLASGTAIKGSPGLPHYVASKGAIISLTRAAARELGAEGIRVNALAPGLTMSEGFRDHPSWSGDASTLNIASRSLKREALPEDLVGALLFLCSPASDFMTGQTVCVDGGSVMI